jgi:hypothetical protein
VIFLSLCISLDLKFYGFIVAAAGVVDGIIFFFCEAFKDDVASYIKFSKDEDSSAFFSSRYFCTNRPTIAL